MTGKQKLNLMEITYQISEKDYLDAQRLAIKNSPVLLFRLSRVVLPCFGLFLLAFLIYAVGQQGFSSKMLPGLIFPFWFMALPLLNRQKQKKLYAQSTNIHGQISLQVNDHELHIQSPPLRRSYDGRISPTSLKTRGLLSCIRARRSSSRFPNAPSPSNKPRL